MAHVIGKAVQGGVDTLIVNYYRHIDRSKVQFDFFIDGLQPTIYDEEIHAMGGRLFKLPPYEKDLLGNLREFRKILRANPYQIIHCHMNSLSVLWLREAKRAKIPIRIAHSHSTASKDEGLRALLKHLLKPFSGLYPTHYAACSEYAARWLFGKKVWESGKVLIIHNAIDLEKFTFRENVRNEVRRSLNLESRFVIGHVGRFARQKNHRFLVNVFKEIYRRDQSAALLLVGDGELRKETEKLAAENGISESVFFLGSRRDVNELFQAMDIFALPSYYEGLPVAAVEAQAAGLPCVMSDRITKEVILGPDASLLSLDSPVQIWADKLLQYKSRERAGGLSTPLSGAFDIRRAAGKLCDFYCSLLETESNLYGEAA